MKIKFWLVMVLLVSIQCLFLSNTARADSAEEDLHISRQFGMIKEVFKAQPEAENAECTIIHIQDAHCNYEAQKNMARILEGLAREYNLRLIMVEGGSGNVGLSYLRAYSDKKTREEVADKYLRIGKISGEEYLDVVSDYNLELYGIEDEALYDAHIAAFWKADSIKEEGLRYAEDLAYIAEKLKPCVYSMELRQMEEKRKDYEEKVISLDKYCRYLKKMVDREGLSLKSCPNITAFSETARLEKEIDFKQAESERNTFIKELAKVLDGTLVKELINKSQEFKSGKITPKDYYSFLKAKAEGKISLRNDYPQLNSYIRYITVSKGINAADLLGEVNSVEEKIKEALFVNDDQRTLNEISKLLAIISGLINLELTPEDYEYFKRNKSKFSAASWVNFLSENCRRYNLSVYPPASSVIDDNLGELEGFYKLGVEREKVFIRNMVNKLNESGEKIAALITGGFHTPGVKRMLKDKGYSYVVVTPTITKKAGSGSIYLSVLRGEKDRLEKALSD